MTKTPEMYARKEANGLYTLRQTRYRARVGRPGNEHPHDVCATGRSVEELKSMTLKHWPDADFSEVERKA